MDYYSSYDALAEAFGVGVAGIFMAFYAVMMLFGIAMYIMVSFAFMKMASKTGVRRGWLSFIPIGNIYIIGRIADAGTGKRKQTRRLMGLLIAMGVIYVPMIALAVVLAVSAPFSDTMPFVYLAPIVLLAIAMSVIAIITEVFLFIAYYKIAHNFGGKDGAAYFVGILLGTFLMPVVSAVLFLILAGKTPTFFETPVTVIPEPPKQDSVF